MPKLDLYYFDFHGGRGEPARLALSIGGVPFEDHRVKGADWPALKPDTPFGSLPVLKVDGETVSQSNAINRYVGRLAGLYPEDALEALRCDEVLEAVEQIEAQVGPTMHLRDEAQKRAAREALAAGPLALHLRTLNARLEARGDWFADGRLTVADLRVFVWIRQLRSGRLDYLPTDLTDQLAPALVAHLARVQAHPGVAAYYAQQAAG